MLQTIHYSWQIAGFFHIALLLETMVHSDAGTVVVNASETTTLASELGTMVINNSEDEDASEDDSTMKRTSNPLILKAYKRMG